MKPKPWRRRKAGIIRRLATIPFLLGVTAAMVSIPSIRPISAQKGRFSDMDQTNGRSGGSRGCMLAAPPSDILPALPALILLASQPGNTMRTRSQRPTFAWYVRDAGNWPLEFRIYRQSAQTPTQNVVHLKHQDFISRQGIMTLALPEQNPPLQPGETYLWQVVIQCEQNETSSNIFATSTLEIMPSLDLDQGPRETHRADDDAGLGNGRSCLDVSSTNSSSNLTPSSLSTCDHDDLKLWLRDRLQGNPASKQFSWEQLGLSATEAIELDRSPVNWVSPWKGNLQP